MLAEVLLARGDREGALSSARQAAAALERPGGVEEGDALVRLALARALDAAGDRAGARAAVAEARARVEERAARIGDPALRASFFDHVPEHATTLALARAWLD